MKTLTLQIEKANFDAILKGEQKTEHRFIHPASATKYIYFKVDGIEYKKQDDIPEGDSDIDIIPVKYDALYLINGRRKDSPRLLVEVESEEFVVFQDEDGNDMTYERDGQEFIVCQVWYHLGKVISTENV